MVQKGTTIHRLIIGLNDFGKVIMPYFLTTHKLGPSRKGGGLFKVCAMVVLFSARFQSISVETVSVNFYMVCCAMPWATTWVMPHFIALNMECRVHGQHRRGR